MSSNGLIYKWKAPLKGCFLLLIIFAFCEPNYLLGQVNYVLNPSFEQYSRCPYEYDQIQFANYWSPIDTVNHSPGYPFGSAYCTPEYCNICAGNNNQTGIPKTSFYYHYPRTGNGMTEVMAFTDETAPYPLSLYLRDYLMGRLYKPLIAGKSYCVSFYTTLEQGSSYATNRMGAYLDNGQIDTNTSMYCGLPKTQYTPQIVSTTINNDTLHWYQIEGSFIAKGTEKYITIGNFFDKAQTNYIPSISQGQTGATWYLVDDVSVVESDIPAYAGKNAVIAVGDSVFIGRDEILPGCKWYRNAPGSGIWTLIDTVRAGFWVKPTKGINKYAVQQTICGLTKYDTVTINAWPLGVKQVNGQIAEWSVYPNPARNEVTISNLGYTGKAAIAIYDVSGREVVRQPVVMDKAM